jgi:hypothetical protein
MVLVGPSTPRGENTMAETQTAARLREYETMFLVRPELTDDLVDRLKLDVGHSRPEPV